LQVLFINTFIARFLANKAGFYSLEIFMNKYDFNARYHQAIAASVYVPPEEGIRKMGLENFTDGTRVIGRTFIQTSDIDGNEGTPVEALQCVFLLSSNAPTRDLVPIPAQDFMFHCENGAIDFEERGSLELEPHTLELTFETLERADEFAELALTEGGANFVLTFDDGHIEVIILEARRG
jgi:hypothetical protein